ncbi:MAG: hypothetical protein ACK524_09735 [Planctomyces sp.]
MADIRAREANPLMNRTFEEIPQFIAPHPELAEALFDPPRVAGRNGAPKVIVQADKLTNAKREDLYNFVVNDNRKVKQHQVESVRVEGTCLPRSFFSLVGFALRIHLATEVLVGTSDQNRLSVLGSSL